MYNGTIDFDALDSKIERMEARVISLRQSGEDADMALADSLEDSLGELYDLALMEGL